jgi:hypothetical protein
MESSASIQFGKADRAAQCARNGMSRQLVKASQDPFGFEQYGWHHASRGDPQH